MTDEQALCIALDRIVYIIACICTLGLVYLIRVIITQGVGQALSVQRMRGV